MAARSLIVPLIRSSLTTRFRKDINSFTPANVPPNPEQHQQQPQHPSCVHKTVENAVSLNPLELRAAAELGGTPRLPPPSLLLVREAHRNGGFVRREVGGEPERAVVV